ncbi:MULTISPECIES: phage major capsid protein [Companilactobacillus]|jgi:HK97 family phage major capsid protein|uniref:Capsid protein n=1 Tax=Companilactobacillus tucceti DSM 20183 TaxID=1423811 RepID=A0A0R1J898_9LACO|nr:MULTISPECIES: phage major capsid protein [Companilactobacillus]KRK64356.1 capsid protein [Companilactobacillus tucceti DSM 20183]MCH4008138.1 phage major capsid protein [Companilactobacillus sp.]MCH4051683.1 phage major capsid protein [Companilactobacillus sp.]MCH4076081.1 phage major capsid protein [Companilactobacillus sp.]MCH4124656.1 phage major capsid protein [Companilactobacillus sp.]
MDIKEIQTKIDEAEKFIRSDAPQEEKDKKMEEIRSLTKDFENSKEIERAKSMITKNNDDDKKDSEDEDKSSDEGDKKKEDKRSMPEKTFQNKEVRNKITVKPQEEVRSALNAYVHSRGEKRDGVKEVGNEVIVPKDIVYDPKQPVQTQYDLRQFVQNTSVTTASGTYPVQDKVDAVFHTVEELEQNPTLANPTFKSIDYKVATYRGQLPISQEMIDDTDFDVAGLIGQYIQKQILNTTNQAIAEKMKTATPVSLSSKDDITDSIKEILNVKLDPAYMPKIVATSSFIQAVDTLKDKQGHYLLQDNIAQGTGKMLLGLDLVRIPDTLLGKSGDAIAWIGDPRAITFFDRNQNTIRWQDNPTYGQILAGNIRFDTEVTDSEGAFLLTLAGTTTPTPSKA